MNYKKLAQRIEKHYLFHGVLLKLILIEIIGACERFIFKLKLKPGTKESLIFDRSSDIQIALELPLFQPFRDGLSICLAVSERPIKENSLQKMLASQKFRINKMWIPIALGYNMRGEMFFVDLGKMPHAMYAGATSSGKSVGLLCLILSIISKLSVNRANIILFDVGANTMEPFEGASHLSCPIVKDTETGVCVIMALVDEMERRIKLDYEELWSLPAIVCIIDEYVSLITNIGDKKISEKLANAISNLLRRGRHAKIHIILATQDPTIKNMRVDVGNITARMAFACAKYHNSITIIGESGAEKLPGKGAMLFKSNEYPQPVYLQGAFIAPDEVKRLVAQISSEPHDFSNKFVIPEFNSGISQPSIQMDGASEDNSPNEDCGKKELADIIIWSLGRENISANQIQEHFRIGNRAYDIVDELHRMNFVSEKFANQPRSVLPMSVEDIPTEVMEFLLENGVSKGEITTAINNRPR